MFLVILKYLGLCLAAVSSVWGTMHDMTTTGPNGRKRLTKPGIGAIVLILAGLVVSIASEDLTQRQEAADQADRLRTEADRTNQIVLSAQPLTRLSWVLQISSEDPALHQAMQKAETAIQENAESSQGGVPRVRFERH